MAPSPLGPISYLSFLLIKELGFISEYLKGERHDVFKNILEYPIVKIVIERITSSLRLTEGELERAITDYILMLRQELMGRITRGVLDIIGVTINFVFRAFSIFSLLRDGPTFFKKISDYLPFSEVQKDRLIKRAEDVIASTIYGGVVVAMVQGFMGGITFFILGISSPVLWGFSMAIATFLPLIGPFIVWVPAAIYLFIQGELWRGVALSILGAFGISLIDNFLRPIIIGNRTKMPILIIFFSVLGGIKLFGLIGFVMGPLVLATFFSVIELFRTMEESHK